MAIERTYLYGSSTTTAAAKLHEYLNTNAVPTYFDRIELNSDTVSCYVGEVELLKIKMFLNGSGNGVTITTENGETVNHGVGGTAAHFQYAYNCNNGISFAAALNSDVVFTITKDNAGNTTLIYDVVSGGNYLSTVKNSSSNKNQIYVVNKNCQSIFYKSFDCTNNGEQATMFCPLVVGDTKNYTPNAFLMPYAEYTTQGTIDVDGCKYISNGIWCVKDE